MWAFPQLHHCLLLIVACLPTIRSEIRNFELFLEPASEYIQYIEGFLLAPGYIDLSQLKFYTKGEGRAGDVDDDPVDDFDDGIVDDDDGGGTRMLAEEEDHTFGMDGSIVEVAVFHLPQNCSRSALGCDWTELGIGSRTPNDILRYCCSADAIDKGLCTSDSYGRLIVNGDQFTGKHRVITIPGSGPFDSELKYPKINLKASDGNGKYVVVFANCNSEGRPVMVEGRTIWKSHHGYLPGDLFGLMYFFSFLFLVYFVLLMWYGITMKMHEDGYIPIQNWIFTTVSMGCLELFFRTGDLFVWNEDGTRFFVAFYVGVILGVLKRGISRCLIVMVSLGWGVIRDDIGLVMKKITYLGGAYVLTALFRDIIEVVAYTEIQKLHQDEDAELLDIASILSLVVALIDVVFYLWIIDSLNATMEYLESARQILKLRRYLRLRCLFLFSILFVVVWTVFGMVNSVDEGIVDQESEWVIDAFMEMNYLYILIGVAVLWRPQENAKDYAYVMELSPFSDEEITEGELELSAVVPSAADSEDEDEEEVVFDDEE